MFVIIHNNYVILGPMRWNKYRFENEIQEECEVNASLPQRNESDIITVSDEVKIYPVILENRQEYNTRTQFLNGPYWEFTDTGAIASYVAENLPIDVVKTMMKAECATERYHKESAGTKTTIQKVEVTIDTSRDGRNIFAQKYLLMQETDVVQWKFPEGWFTLNKAELGQIVATGATYIQQQFDWESNVVTQIDAMNTLIELNTIVIPKTVVFPGVM